MAYCLVERESCDERLRFLRTRRSRTMCPTTKWLKAKEKVAQKVESIFKKPHRAAGKLTLSERKFVEETGVDGNECTTRRCQWRRRTCWSCQKDRRRECD